MKAPRYTRGIVTALVLLFGVERSALGQVDDRVAKVAALASQANLEAFPYYKCRFTITLANAASPEKALQSEYTDVRRYDHLLVVDGGKEKLETLGPVPQVKHRGNNAQRKGGREFIPLDFVPLGYLRNGDEALNYSSLLSVASLHAKEVPAELTDSLPLSMGVMGFRRERSPGPLLKRCDDGELFLAKAAEGAINKVPVIELVFAAKTRQLYRFSLDVQQGYLPKEVICYTPPDGAKELVHVYLREARQCSRNRWFPTHTVRLLTPFKSPVPVVDIRVTELEVDKRPTGDDFTLTLPAGTEIKSARNDGKQFFYLKQQEQVSPGDIPRLFQMLRDVNENPRMDTAVHKPGWPYKSYAYMSGAGVLFCLGGVVWWRLRARAG